MVNNKKILDKLKVKPFSPPIGISNGITQTVLARFLPDNRYIQKGTLHIVELSDGDKLAITQLTPQSWKNGYRIIVLVHGLGGSQDSHYIKRLSEKFFSLGYLVIKVNLRSCGPGRGLAQNPYHSGSSNDTAAVIAWLQSKYSKSPISQIGFSLAANMTLKMVSEKSQYKLNQLDSCIVVSTPLDLVKSANKIAYNNFKIFNKFFLTKMMSKVDELRVDFPNKIDIQFPENMNIIDFDNYYTAPLSGFVDSLDYYTKTSGNNFVSQISIPTLMLHSQDDPVVDSADIHRLEVPSCIDVLETLKGGHVGFLDHKGFWMDRVIVKWIEQFDNKGY